MVQQTVQSTMAMLTLSLSRSKLQLLYKAIVLPTIYMAASSRREWLSNSLFNIVKLLSSLQRPCTNLLARIFKTSFTAAAQVLSNFMTYKILEFVLKRALSLLVPFLPVSTLRLVSDAREHIISLNQRLLCITSGHLSRCLVFHFLLFFNPSTAYKSTQLSVPWITVYCCVRFKVL